MAKHLIVISRDDAGDKHCKGMLLAWDKNAGFAIAFSDNSADVSIQRRKAEASKRGPVDEYKHGHTRLTNRGTQDEQDRLGGLGNREGEEVEEYARRGENGLRQHDTERPPARGSVVGEVIHIRRHQEGNRRRASSPNIDGDGGGRGNGAEPHL